MNIYDIAKKANVSIATVSRVLNGSAKVRASTREKIEIAMKEMNYTPNIFARGLGLNSMKMIGVLCMDVSDLYYAKAVNSLEQKLRVLGYDVLLYCTGYEKEEKEMSIKRLLQKRVDAIITIGCGFVDNIDEKLIKESVKQCPTILINSYKSISGAYNIYCDEEQAIYETTKKMVENGLKNITYFYNKETSGSKAKKQGFKKAIAQMGIEDSCFIHKTLYNIDTSKSSALEFLQKHNDIDSIICSEDIIAVGALKATEELKINIPIIGFNNSLLCKCTTPTLTSVDNLLEAVCINAISTLTNVFNNIDMPETVVLSAKLVERESFTL